MYQRKVDHRADGVQRDTVINPTSVSNGPLKLIERSDSTNPKSEIRNPKLKIPNYLS
ncbi:hypothetical protein D1AOALGA4SA_7497 [Olavius algarvensis Delta 1 endosymbiont]|nr:hypothetical protein D1AOALGA4SA_7497 [Olavius algarvensis Delta 1 endosymbiont]